MKSDRLEDRVAEMLTTPRLYHKCWLDAAAVTVAEVGLLRRSFQRLHRRAQQAEAQALREGRRADRMAGQLRRLLTQGGCRGC